jgi:hypothetical protein
MRDAGEFQKILDHPSIAGFFRPSLRVTRRHWQSQGGPSGFPHALEGRRPGHSDFYRCES